MRFTTKRKRVYRVLYTQRIALGVDTNWATNIAIHNSSTNTDQFSLRYAKKSNNNERFDEFYFYFSDNSRFFGYHKNEIISKYARFGMLLLPFFRFHLLDFVFSSFLIYHKRNGQALFIFTSVILAFSSFLSNTFFYTKFQAIVYKYGIMLK